MKREKLISIHCGVLGNAITDIAYCRKSKVSRIISSCTFLINSVPEELRQKLEIGDEVIVTIEKIIEEPDEQQTTLRQAKTSDAVPNQPLP